MKKRPIIIASIFMLIFIVEIVQILWINLKYENKYKEIEGKEEIKVKAVIISEADEKEYKYIYEIEIIEADDQNITKILKGTHWLLNIKKSNNNVANEKLQYGDFFEVAGKFEIPSEERNYKGFNYKKYLKTKKLYGNITVADDIKIIEKNKTNIVEKILHGVSKSIKNRIYELLDEDASKVCIGMLIGERKDISNQITEAFKGSNLTHMLAVSGAHISYIVLGISKIFNRTYKKVGKIFTICFLIFFMGLTGFSASVERASIMTILTIMSTILYRKSNVYSNLIFSAIIVLIFNPYSIFDIGFQLSYGGTIGIILLSPKISKYIYEKLQLKHKAIKTIVNMIIVSISANIVIIPIMMYHFNTLSITFLISNILAGPLLGIIIILGFIVYLVSLISINLASFIVFPLQLILNLLIYIASFCSKLPLSTILVKTPYLIEIIVYYICIYFLFFCQKKLKFIILLIILILSYKVFPIKIERNVKIYFVDVGQGDCILISTPTNKTILIDGGGSENSSFNVGEKTLLPYLLDRRITKIDYALISHFDTDHVEGLLYVLKKIEVGNVIVAKQGKVCDNYESFKEIVNKKNINVIIANKDKRIQIDKYTYFDILFPSDELICDNVLNNNSIVAKFCYYNFSMLFTGDIEKIAEEKIISEYANNKEKLNSTILKVAHHGSKSSSIEEILDLIKPKIALIGVGEKNTFGHPSEEVLNRLEEVGSKIYRTDLYGEIEIIVNAKGKIKIKK